MPWLTVLTLILENAPEIIQTVDDGITWAQKAWTSTKAAYDKPADQITKEELVAHLATIKRSSDLIQGIE